MRRIDDDGGRSPRWKTTAMATLLASRGRVRRVCSSTGSGRSSGMRRGSEGVAVAVGELVGGDGCVRASEREEAEERNEGEGESEGVQGVGAAPRR